jgi:hypothetical protein
LGCNLPTLKSRIERGEISCVVVEGEEKNWKGIPLNAIKDALLGLTPEIKNLASEVMKELEKRAEKSKSKNDLPIAYSKIMELVGLDSGYPRHRGMIGHVLGEVTRQSLQDKERGFALSAMAVQKRSGLPSQSFFEYLKELGFKFRDKRVFWDDQISRIWNYYH